MKKRVVLIEDMQDLAILERALLEQEGFEVVVPVLFSNLLNNEYWEGVDAAIVDLTLPGSTTGKEILVWLKRNAPSVRRICVTGANISPEEVEAEVFLQKPFEPKNLVGAIRG